MMMQPEDNVSLDKINYSVQASVGDDIRDSVAVSEGYSVGDYFQTNSDKIKQ